MINIQNAKEVFEKYVKKFNPEDGRIKLKIEHIQRVAKFSREIAEKLNLSEEQINLAELIGYFHDIGRFKQAEVYNTFSDKESGINHAEYSIKVLYSDGLINEFNIDAKYNKLIKAAVLNHNKASIEDGLNEEELLFSKIIRDADKLDILNHIITEYDFESVFWYPEFDCEKINDKLVNNFMDQQKLDYINIKNNADQILSFFSYIYDINFKDTLKMILESECFDIFAKRIYEVFQSEKVKEQTKQILKYTNNYLENKQ